MGYTTETVEVLVCYPGCGSVWLDNAVWRGDFVEGSAWDDSSAGSPYMPDDFMGESVWMNFPLSCVQKVRTSYGPRSTGCAG